MEKPETLKIFVCETFIVNDGPEFHPSPVLISSLPITRRVDLRDFLYGVPSHQARPPTVSYYNVRTLRAAMI